MSVKETAESYSRPWILAHAQPSYRVADYESLCGNVYQTLAYFIVSCLEHCGIRGLFILCRAKCECVLYY